MLYYLWLRRVLLSYYREQRTDAAMLTDDLHHNTAIKIKENIRQRTKTIASFRESCQLYQAYLNDYITENSFLLAGDMMRNAHLQNKLWLS